MSRKLSAKMSLILELLKSQPDSDIKQEIISRINDGYAIFEIEHLEYLLYMAEENK